MLIVGSIVGFAVGLGANALVARWPGRGSTSRHNAGWLLPVVGVVVVSWLATAIDDPIRLAILAGFVGVLLLVAGLDLTYRLVPNVVVVPATLAAVAFGPAGPLASIGGALLGLALFGALYWLGQRLYGRPALGMGDVKLAMLLGAIAGVDDAGYVVLLAILLGGAAAAVLLISKRADRQTTLPYGLFLVLAGLIMLVITARS